MLLADFVVQGERFDLSAFSHQARHALYTENAGIIAS